MTDLTVINDEELRDLACKSIQSIDFDSYFKLLQAKDFREIIETISEIFNINTPSKNRSKFCAECMTFLPIVFKTLPKEQQNKIVKAISKINLEIDKQIETALSKERADGPCYDVDFRRPIGTFVLASSGTSPDDASLNQPQQHLDNTALSNFLFKSDYGYLWQNKELNAIALTSNSDLLNVITESGISEYAHNKDVIIRISDTTELKRLNPSARQNYLTFLYLVTNGYGREISISLKEFMGLRELKDEKEARKTINKDLFTLSRVQIEYTRIVKGKKEKKRLNICEEVGDIHNGYVHFTFSPTFYSFLTDEGIIMPVNRKLLSIRSGQNNAFDLLYYLFIYKNMNIGESREDIISVRSLLPLCDKIPTYETVKSSNRGYTQRIIVPFEKNLDALNDVLTWEYCHEKKRPFTDEELICFDYDTFINAYIKITWINYPDNPKLIQEKQKKQTTKGKKAMLKSSRNK